MLSHDDIFVTLTDTRYRSTEPFGDYFGQYGFIFSRKTRTKL